MAATPGEAALCRSIARTHFSSSSQLRRSRLLGRTHSSARRITVNWPHTADYRGCSWTGTDTSRRAIPILPDIASREGLHSRPASSQQPSSPIACALRQRGPITPGARVRRLCGDDLPPPPSSQVMLPLRWREERSEERRVGKECRSRGSPYHYQK